MRKAVRLCLGLCMAAMLMAGNPPLPARAASGSISMSVSASSVNIGDTITVTVKGSADEDALIQATVSCSGGAEGAGNSMVILEPSAGGSDSASLTFKATSPGTATFTASVVEAYGVASNQALSISGASASVTIKNAASGGNSGGASGGSSGGGSGGGQGGASASQSADNSLKSLSISPGTLSPAFKYSTTKYTASVASDVTDIAVDAKTSHAKASVESVTGNTGLKPGDNSIKITVKAENGTIAVYTIVVNRGGAAGEDPTEDPGAPEEGPQDNVPEMDILIGGRSYKVNASFPEDTQLPGEFQKSVAAYGGQEVEVYSFPYGNLTLYSLTEALPEGADPESAANGFFFLHESSNSFFPYISITVGKRYVIVLPSSYDSAGSLPPGYEAAEAMFGAFSMDGYQLGADYMQGVEQAGDFYLVYGVSQDGTTGWYQYDSLEGSLQRYVPLSIAGLQENPGDPGASAPAVDEETRKAFEDLQEKYQKEKNKARLLLCALIFVVVAAVIAIVNIVIFGRKGSRGDGDDGELDYIDFDEY